MGRLVSHLRSQASTTAQGTVPFTFRVDLPSTVKPLWKYLIETPPLARGDPKSRKVDKEDSISNGKLKMSRKMPVNSMGFLSMLVLSVMLPRLDKVGREGLEMQTKPNL